MLNTVTDRIRTLVDDLIKDKRMLIKVLSIVAILMLAIIFKTHESGQSDITVEAATENTESDITSEICVDIGGAVQRPGVYRVANGTRLYEVIEIAGGLRSDADTNSVNQAAFVEDGVKVIIPILSNVNSDEDFSLEESQWIDNNAAPISSDMPSSSIVNINIADKEQLKTLSGIGDVIAERIIEYRSKGSFKTKEDIMSVKGIGNAIYEKIKDQITV